MPGPGVLSDRKALAVADVTLYHTTGSLTHLPYASLTQHLTSLFIPRHAWWARCHGPPQRNLCAPDSLKPAMRLLNAPAQCGTAA